MAASAGGRGGITQINITPMVDIVLVLLVIFMVTTSAMSASESVEVDKPDAATGAAADSDSESLVLTCDATGKIFAGSVELVSDAEVVDFAKRAVKTDPKVQAILRCDGSADVNTLVRLIDLTRKAGVHKYAIATDPKVEEREG